MSKGVQFGLAYTLSKVITDSPDDRTTIAQDLRNLGADRAIALFDKTHIFVTNYIWELPFFKDADKLVYNLLGGWQIGGIYRLETGTPLTVTISPNRANSFFGGGQRPDLIGNPEGSRTIEQWFNPTAFALPAVNTFGNAGRSLLRGPGLNLCDLSIYKNFRISETVRVQFRGELFNALNHTNSQAWALLLGRPPMAELPPPLSQDRFSSG